uniref:Uncharacterized protein n=1 Tax=Oryza rufipogon TaxID=4529 RepID=A0A0E0NH41_ORYRU
MDPSSGGARPTVLAAGGTLDNDSEWVARLLAGDWRLNSGEAAGHSKTDPDASVPLVFVQV